MKLTLISEQYGTTVEINFEATHIDQIREMFDQFLRGSGFHVEDEDDMYTKQENNDTSEECVHESDKEEPQRPVKSYTGGVPWYATEEPKREWVGLSDTEAEIYGNQFNGICLVKGIEALLKERNNG